jgi:hypothetical protein
LRDHAAASGWTEQGDEPVKNELDRADFQARSCQAIQCELPRRVRTAIALAKGIGISLYLSP